MIKMVIKNGTIKWFKKPTAEGFSYAKYEMVTPIHLNKKPGVGKSFMKWVKYY